jgi:deoxyribonuclease-4
MYGSGYDLVNNLDEVISSADKLLGLENIPVIHFNDSKVDLGSNVDRHENIGEGKIGKDAMTKFLNHPKLKSKDFVLETPALKDIESSKVEVDKLKSWAK